MRNAGLVMLAIVAPLLGCSGGDGAASCVPGQQVSCPCLGGGLGIQVCAADRTFGPCNCGGGIPDGGQAGQGRLASACSLDAECGTNLICGQGGLFANLCTAPCTNTIDCETLFGDNTNCVAGYCTIECAHTDDCAAGAHCRPWSLPDYCVSGKGDIAATCSRNDQCLPGLICSNASGLFGGNLCTAPCTIDYDCELLSPGTECLASAGVCVDACVDVSDCPTGWFCQGTPELRNSYGYCYQ